jgi:hypothetical protein
MESWRLAFLLTNRPHHTGNRHRATDD